METRFLNVDLDILSRTSLEPLVTALGKGIFVHYVGAEGRQQGAHLSLSSYGQSADALMRALVRRVNRLTPAARKLWDGAVSREFNVGIQAGLTPHSHELLVSSETLKMVAKVGGRIGITTYAPAMHPEQARRILAEKGVPPNNEMLLTRSAMTRRRGPRR